MKVLFLGLVLTLSATPSFAKCTYSINGNDFTPFNGKTIKIGSREITVARDIPNDHVITIKGLDGITHFYGTNALLVDVIDHNDRLAQISCEN